MQPTQLPPLGTLVAFEAAAEYGSFASAAKKLFVTPAAISQKIQVLEQHLGVVLFDRSKMGVKLTRVGQSYLVFIHEGLERIRLGQQQIKQFSNLDVLTITTLPSMATKWLMPKVLEWMELNPDVEIRIEASHKKVDFNQSASDICICFGEKNCAGLEKIQLFTDSVSVVASPQLLSTIDVQDDLQTIAGLPMIHIDWGDHNHNLPDWNDWLKAVGLDIPSTAGPHFNLSSIAIQAAVKGKGLLLGQHGMIADELKNGQLVKLSNVKTTNISLPLGEAYFMAYPKRTLDNPNAVAFINWLTLY